MLSRPETIKRKFSYALDVDAMLQAAEEGDRLFFFNLLCQRRIDNREVNTKNSDGYNALMIACVRNHYPIVHSLLQGMFTNLNHPNDEGWTPLMLAIYYGSLNATLYLIDDMRCNVSAADPIGGTALMYAAFHGRPRSIKALLSREDINVNAQDHEGWSAVMYAVYGKHRGALMLLLASPDVDLFLLNNQNETVEDIAVHEGNKTIIKLIRAAMLIKRPSRANAKRVSFSQDTLPAPAIYDEIYTAVVYRHPVNVRACLDRGMIDVNGLDYRGDTLAIVAASLGQANMLQLLAEEYHADLTRKNACEWSPLLYAAFYGHTEAVTYLLSRAEIQTIVCHDEEHLAEHLATLGGHEGIANQISEFIKANARPDPAPVSSAIPSFFYSQPAPSNTAPQPATYAPSYP